MVIIITGASKGIGKAVAERFATAGHTLVLCARGAAQLNNAADEIRKSNPGCIVHAQTADISIKDEVMAFVAWALQTAGIPNIVINNAAYFENGSINNEEDGLLEKMFATNLYGAYYLTRAFLPAMMENKHGHIFNICSVAALQGSPAGGAYSISKFALDGFTKNLREELKPYHIKVTGVYPGAVYTESWHGSGVNPAALMQPRDIAELIHASSQLSPQACVEDIIVKPF